MEPVNRLIALDLEFNQPSQRIIQIGAAMGSLATLAVEASFSVLIHPKEPIVEYIEKLTGITNEMVEADGVTLEEGFAQLKAFMTPYKPFINPVTWGGGDAEALREALGHSHEGWPFGRRWIDVKTLHVTNCLATQSKPVGGLSSSMKQYGLYFEGCKHNAMDDSANTLRLYFEMIRRQRNQLPAIGKLST